MILSSLFDSVIYITFFFLICQEFLRAESPCRKKERLPFGKRSLVTNSIIP
jgi:hypothetical protein